MLATTVRLPDPSKPRFRSNLWELQWESESAPTKWDRGAPRKARESTARRQDTYTAALDLPETMHDFEWFSPVEPRTLKVRFPMAALSRALTVSALLLSAVLAANCGSIGDGSPFGDGDAAGGGGGGGGDGGGGGGFGFQEAGNGEASRPCVGLECQQVACSGGTTTTVTGTVYAPEGTVPLYNAIVYVPNSKPEPFKEGIVCEQCGQVTGSPVVTAITNEKGEFRLTNVPVGDDIPLVIQIGKWRRQITIPKVEKCVDTPLDAGDTRLPRNKSEGDLPQIAFTSGNADSLECFLRKLGVSDSEFTPPTGDGRVHFFRGNGSNIAGGAPDATTLWGNSANLKNCLLYTSPSPRDRTRSRMPSSA